MNKKVESKESPSIVKTDGVKVTWQVNAYTGTAKAGTLALVGTGTVICFSEKEKDLQAVRSLLTIADIKRLNRQIKTDKRNGLARVSEGKSFLKALEALAHFDSSFEPMVTQLKLELKQGEVEPTTIKAIKDAMATFKASMKKAA